MDDKLIYIYRSVTGLILLFFGIMTLLYPYIMTLYGISVETAQTRIAIRGLIGGGEITFAAIVLFGPRFGFDKLVCVRLIMLLFLGIGLTRLLSGLWEGWDIFWGLPLRESLLEICLGLLGLYILRRARGYSNKLQLEEV